MANINDSQVFDLVEGGQKLDLFQPTPTVVENTKPHEPGEADLHTTLDVAGWVNPIADVANASMYLYEKEYGSAALAGASILPVVDILKWAWKGIKGLGKGKKVARLGEILPNIKMPEIDEEAMKQAFIKQSRETTKVAERMLKEHFHDPIGDVTKLAKGVQLENWDHKTLDEILDVITLVGVQTTSDYATFVQRLGKKTFDINEMDIVRPGYKVLFNKVQKASVDNPKLKEIYDKVKNMHYDDMAELRRQVSEILDVNEYARHLKRNPEIFGE